MTKFDALSALHQKKRVTHSNIYGHKWMKEAKKDNYYEFDDGTTIRVGEFWDLRNSFEEWETGWIILD